MWTGEELSLRGVSRDFFANPCPGEDKLRQRVAARIAANRHGKVVRVRLQGEKGRMASRGRPAGASGAPPRPSLPRGQASRPAAPLAAVPRTDEQTVTFHDLVRAESDLSKADAPTQEELAVKRMRVTALTEVLRRHEANAEALRTQRKALTQLLKAVIRGKGRAGMIEAVPDVTAPPPPSSPARTAAPSRPPPSTPSLPAEAGPPAPAEPSKPQAPPPIGLRRASSQPVPPTGTVPPSLPVASPRAPMPSPSVTPRPGAAAAAAAAAFSPAAAFGHHRIPAPSPPLRTTHHHGGMHGGMAAPTPPPGSGPSPGAWGTAPRGAGVRTVVGGIRLVSRSAREAAAAAAGGGDRAGFAHAPGRAAPGPAQGHTPGRDEDRAQAAGPALGRQTSAPAAPGHDRTHTPRRSWDSRDFRGRSWR